MAMINTYPDVENYFVTFLRNNMGVHNQSPKNITGQHLSAHIIPLSGVEQSLEKIRDEENITFKVCSLL